MMTGIFLRVQRGGRWLNLDIAEMSKLEVDVAMRERDAAELRNWVVALAGCIQSATENGRPASGADR